MRVGFVILLVAWAITLASSQLAKDTARNYRVQLDQCRAELAEAAE